jgi:4-hydroxy-3-polyprenylbenzoate decarboxylase
MHPLILAITGASGAVYAVRLLEVLLASGREVHLLISPSGKAVLKQELGLEINLEQFDPAPLLAAVRHRLLLPPLPLGEGRGEGLARTAPSGKLLYHAHDDFMAPPASGSFLTGGMVVCPCSGSTLSGIAHASGSNLIQRAADVHLKEHRRLILVPRETPLSIIQLDNMRRAAEAGAVILPAMPGWYHGVSSISDLVDFIVARILDQLAIPHTLMKRWGS